MNSNILKVHSIFKKLNIGNNIKFINGSSSSSLNKNLSLNNNNNNSNGNIFSNFYQNSKSLLLNQNSKSNNILSYTTSSNNNSNKVDEIIKSTTSDASPFTPLNVLHPKLVGEKLYTSETDSNNQPKEFKAEITTLPNGIRVVSKQTHEGVCAIGLYINAGTKFETPENRGVFNLLEKMTFKKTKNHTTSEIIRELEEISLNAMASSSREMINVSIEVLRKDLEFVLSIFADQIKNPAFEEEEIKEQQEICIRNYEMITNSSSDQLLTEILMGVAYGESGLGNLVVATPDQYLAITRQKLLDTLKQYYVGKNIVISVTGAEHSQVLEMVDKYFGDIPYTQKDTPSEHLVDSQTHYKGGTDASVAGSIQKQHLQQQLYLLKQQLSELEKQKQQPSPQETIQFIKEEIESLENNLTQLEQQEIKESSWLIAFPYSGLATVAENKDVIVGLVLQSLLGGGSSYSTGGPGKGMQSRLNLNVVYASHHVKNCHAFLFVFNKVSLFGVSLTTESGYLQDGIELVLSEILMLSKTMDSTELERAKRSQKSQILQNLELRSVQCDDMARHLLSYGTYKSPEQICKLIDSVTLDDVRQLILKLLKSNPSVVSIVANENESILTAEQYVQIIKQNSNLLK